MGEGQAAAAAFLRARARAEILAPTRPPEHANNKTPPGHSRSLPPSPSPPPPHTHPASVLCLLLLLLLLLRPERRDTGFSTGASSSAGKGKQSERWEERGAKGYKINSQVRGSQQLALSFSDRKTQRKHTRTKALLGKWKWWGVWRRRRRRGGGAVSCFQAEAA